ncbi:MAG: DUF1016 N-terminal domain-containing protein [Patescibacteria group bacterium]
MTKNEIYNQLLEDCKSIIGESGYKQNVTTLESRWELGRAIVQVNDEMKRQKIYGKEIIENLSHDLGPGYSTRVLYYCVEFYQQYKEERFCNVLQNLPEGKNTNWRDMCHKHLKSTQEGAKNDKKEGSRPPREMFKLSEIEDAFKNFARDCLGIDEHDQLEDRWEEFEEYFNN